MGTPITTRGLVLRCHEFSNTSQIVTAFTRDLGIVSFLARGSHRNTTRAQVHSGPLDLASWYDLVLEPRRGELAFAAETDIVESFEPLRHDIARFTEACYAIELLSRVIEPRDPHPDLLLDTLRFFKLLGVGVGRVALRIHFVQAVLRELGVAPNWELCTECGQRLEWDDEVSVVLPDGVVHTECLTGTPLPLPTGLRRYLHQEQELPWGRVPSLNVTTAQAGEAWRLLAEFLPYQLDARLRAERELRSY